MSLNSRDDQTNKKASQAKNKANLAKQGSESEKSSEKARKEKRRRAARDGAKGQTLQLEQMPLQQSQVVKDRRRKRRLEISLKLLAIVAIKMVTTPPIVPSQKN